MYAEDWLLVSLLIHVPVAVTWIALVGIEAFLCTVREVPGGQRMRPIAAMRWPTVALLALILLTGVLQTMNNPFVVVRSWATLEELRTTTAYGTALFWKHIFVVATVAFAIVSRFVIAPRAIAAGEDRPSMLLRAVAYLDVVACLLVLLSTTRMTITLH
ncbi:MAG: hypothetical protein WCQ48_03715 [Chloroflexota bacterium]